MIEKYAKNALNWKKKLKFIYKIKKKLLFHYFKYDLSRKKNCIKNYKRSKNKTGSY